MDCGRGDDPLDGVVVLILSMEGEGNLLLDGAGNVLLSDRMIGCRIRPTYLATCFC